MSIDKAYSKEIQRNISAKEADSLFQKGIIRSKYEFECPDENCTVQVICANLDKPKEKRKVQPYFKFSNDEHIKGCSIGEEWKKESNTIRGDGIYPDKLQYVIGLARLDISLRQVSKQVEKIEKSTSSYTSSIKSIKNNSNTQIKTRKNYMKISSLVTSFENGENFEIQLPTGSIVKLQNFFTEISGQDIDTFDDDFQIYYGKAWINKYNDGFLVKFDKKLRCGDIEVRPTFFINKKDIENYPYEKFQIQQLDKLCGKTPKIVYLLCDIAPYCKSLENEKTIKYYINFKLENLACLEISS